MNLLDLSPVALGASGAPRCPGLSSLLPSGWVHGAGALQVCRVDPQSTCFDVWEALSLDPVQPAGGMRHRADLAVAQLRALDLDLQADWCVAVPAGWAKPEWQVFLGVAQEVGLKVRVLFPRALAVAALARPEAGAVSVLEWGWRSLSRIQVEVENGSWRITRQDPLAEGGVLDAFRRESRVAASWMLQRHRVDPLHTGRTEQQVFDGWWNWHSGQSPAWILEARAQTMEASADREKLVELEWTWGQTHGVEDVAEVLMPGALKHLTGFQQVGSEPADLRPALEGLEIPDGEGARWRDSLSGVTPVPSASPQITHVVVAGIAEPAPAGLICEPGAQVTLADGREGMAIHLSGA